MFSAETAPPRIAIKRTLGILTIKYPELLITVVYGFIVLCISILIQTRFSFPSTSNSIFIGIHYSTALLLGGIGAILGVVFRLKMSGKQLIESILLIAFENFAYLFVFLIIVWLNLHVKMWIPLINPFRFDELYFNTDTILKPLINYMLLIRLSISRNIEIIDHLYMIFFILMFMISFLFHSAWDRRNIRRLFMASILVQAIGSLCYLIMPAVGPFIFENGLSQHATKCQLSMWEGYQTLVRSGPAWLHDNAPRYFTAGLAAMPSLHVGASWVFVHYAGRSLKYLLVVYIPFFSWIVIEAVASKWHYFIDLPVGVALALLCIWLADTLEDRRARWEGSERGALRA